MRRYKANLIGGIIQMGLFIILFGFFATAINFRGFDNFNNESIFIFFLGGISLLAFQDIALWSPVEVVQRDIYNGTLEYLYFSPGSKYAYFVGYFIGKAIINTSIFFIPILSVLAIFAKLELSQFFTIIMVVVLGLGSIIALGVLVALTAILWKNVTGLIGFLSLIFQFLTGAFIPVTSLPEPIQIISYLIPFTWIYDLIRYYSFKGEWQTLLPVEIEWFILFIFVIVFTLIATRLLQKVERHSKAKGLHLI